MDALMALKSGKTGGRNGIRPDMLKCCRAKVLEHLIEVFSQL